MILKRLYVKTITDYLYNLPVKRVKIDFAKMSTSNAQSGVLNFPLKCPSPMENITCHYFNPSHAAIKISINATAAEFICKNIFPIPVQIKKIVKNKTGDKQQIYLYQNVCK